ncbi:NADH-quinone oxidoreductase subunit NuoI [Acidilobus sp.]|jgi:NADH-quinone oxidoreductase subunit I|uniref:NADH-quinone oxidoreductase subunit NuoI n=1 Tax=Acidilobus sp. TaxID=1872109 RepID=UPI003D042C7E
MPARPSLKRVPRATFLGRAIAGNLGALIVGVKYFIDPNRITLLYPHEYIKLRQGYRGYIVLIVDKCISCASCARICPARAIKMVTMDVKDKKLNRVMKKKYPVINYNRCIFCGYCVDVCPAEALYHVPYHDLVYLNMQDMILNVEEFQKEPEFITAKEGVPVTYVFDEKRGLVKVSVEESSNQGSSSQLAGGGGNS